MSAVVIEAREPSARYLALAEPTLLREFELLASAPSGVSTLRELVLSFAVQGRLCPNEEADGTTFKRPEKVSAKQIPASASKETATFPICETDGIPFSVPRSWFWARLGDVTTYGSCEKARTLSDNTWVLDLEDIEKDTGRLIQRKTFVERRFQSAKSVFRVGDVLYGKLRPYLNKVLVADRNGVCTTEILALRPLAGISPHYLKLTLQSPYFLAYVNVKSYGMKMPRLGTEDGRSALVPVPPLAEQHRIVARVEELMNLCDALEQNGRLADEQHARLTSTLFDALAASKSAHALAENWQRIAEHFDLLLDRPEAIDAFEQTILQLAVRGLLVPQEARDEPADVLLQRLRAEHDRMVLNCQIRREKVLPPLHATEHPFAIPDEWRWARLGDLANFIDYRGRTPVKTTCGVSLITAKNVRKGFIDREPREFIATEAYASWMTRGFPRVGDLLFTTEAPLGNIAIIDVPERFALAQRVICLGFYVLQMSGAMSIFMQSPWMQAAFQAQATGVTAQGIKSARLQLMPLPVPPLAEQHRIVARVEELRRLCAQLRERLTAARRTQALLADALIHSAQLGE